MTVEERFERIEHLTAGLAEERSKDREEYKTLWRDTERQIRELAIHIDEVDARLGNRIEQLGNQLGNRIEQFAAESRAAAEESRAADARLGERIDALVSAIGQLLPEGKK
jgi:DNA anti-recombination protein RmuC